MIRPVCFRYYYGYDTPGSLLSLAGIGTHTHALRVNQIVYLTFSLPRIDRVSITLSISPKPQQRDMSGCQLVRKVVDHIIGIMKSAGCDFLPLPVSNYR
jgi:hypothetical protein